MYTCVALNPCCVLPGRVSVCTFTYYYLRKEEVLLVTSDFVTHGFLVCGSAFESVDFITAPKHWEAGKGGWKDF